MRVSAIAPLRTDPSKEAAQEFAARSVLAVDYGRKRIGLALADEAGEMPRPLATIERKNRREDLQRLKDIVREQGVKRIVVGHPLRLDGTRGPMAIEAERFAERLGKHVGLPVELVDERLTSWDAEQLRAKKEGFTRRTQRKHREHKGSAKKRKGASVDALAAAVILRDYVERTKTQERS